MVLYIDGIITRQTCYIHRMQSYCSSLAICSYYGTSNFLPANRLSHVHKCNTRSRQVYQDGNTVSFSTI